MKIRPYPLTLHILFFSVLFLEGIVGEIIFWIFTCFLTIKNYGYFKRDNRKGVKRFIILYLFMFIFLYIYICWHYKFDITTMIKFLGYTKCICSVAIVAISFGVSAKKINYINFVIIWAIIINIAAFLEDIIAGDILNPGIEFLGASSNILGGFNSIVLAFVFYKKLRSLSLLEKIFLSISIFYILICGSQTAQIMLLFQCTIKIILAINIKGSPGIIRKTIILSIGIIAVLGVYLIINYGAIIDNQGVLDRYNIWNRAIDQFSQRSLLEKIVGTGNDVVQMQFITFIPHDFILEVMLLYGYIGVCLVIGLLIIAIRAIGKSRNSFIKMSMTISLLMFICQIFFHPVFTTCFWLELFFYMCFLQYAYFDKDKGLEKTNEKLRHTMKGVRC